MRPLALLPTPLLFALATALQLPNLQSYLPAVSFPISIADYIPPPPTTAPSSHPQPQQHHPLLARQFSNTCPQNFHSCDNVGAPGLCCVQDAACVADDAGNVACCQEGAVCTGIVNGVITEGTVNEDGDLVSASLGVSSGTVAGAVGGGQVVTSVGSSYVMGGNTASGNGGLVAASSPATFGPAQSSGGGFIVDAGSTVATPGAGARAADVPLVAKVIIRILEMVPL